CIDIDESKVEKLSNGQITIYEPGLEKLFIRNLREERLSFTTELEKGIEDADVIFLALPTPPGEDGSADLKYVLGVADHLGKIMKGYKVIVDKSTVPVGTAEKVHSAIAKNYTDRHIIMGRCAHITEPKKIHYDQGRAKCQHRTICERGCPFGGYFSSNASTLPWAAKTGKMAKQVRGRITGSTEAH
ncbi:MAG: UDP-glucose/GDP-mannose dehydrogenase family protein, partial [Hymenobacter sp.]